MGILKTLRKRRAQAKAELKAAKVRVKEEVKSASKDRIRKQKLIAKQEQNLLKAEKKGLKAKRKHELKLAKTELERRKQGRINKDNVGRYIGVARMVAPLALPLVYRGIVEVQQLFNDRRAKRLGISSEQLAQFAGHGSHLKARIAGIHNSLEGSGLPRGFVMDVEERLTELDKATDNAEFMTADQRRRAHRSINEDLDQITSQIQDRLTRP